MRLRRVSFTRALLSGVAATLSAAVGAVIMRVLPAWGAGLALFASVGVAGALVFALLWDAIPPRTRPVSKAIVFGALAFLIARLEPEWIPAAVAYSLALGMAYRPHPAPPEAPPLRADPPVRAR